jgi:hypothetical protein
MSCDQTLEEILAELREKILQEQEDNRVEVLDEKTAKRRKGLEDRINARLAYDFHRGEWKKGKVR